MARVKTSTVNTQIKVHRLSKKTTKFKPGYMYKFALIFINNNRLHYRHVLLMLHISPIAQYWSVTMYWLLLTDFVDIVRWSCSSSAIMPPK